MSSDFPGSLFVLYLLITITLTILFFVLLTRMARAQERTAAAMEAIARKPEAGAITERESNSEQEAGQ